MLTHPLAIALYRRLCGARAAWLESAEGRNIIAKTYRLVRSKCGHAEARQLRNLMTAANAVDTL